MQRSLRRELEEAAVALIARHGAQILATARRYAARRTPRTPTSAGSRSC